MLTVLICGARSGKSRLAVELVTRSHDLDRAGPAPVFVATCPRVPDDDELDRRIAAHQAERPAHWSTVEATHDLAGALAAIDPRAPVAVDCLTLLVANLQFRGDPPEAVVTASASAIAAAVDRVGPTIVVSNEVGQGIVPADGVSRTYRDLLGRVNQDWVAAADRALYLVAGRAVPLHDPYDLLR